MLARSPDKEKRKYRLDHKGKKKEKEKKEHIISAKHRNFIFKIHKHVLVIPFSIARRTGDESEY